MTRYLASKSHLKSCAQCAGDVDVDRQAPRLAMLRMVNAAVHAQALRDASCLHRVITRTAARYGITLSDPWNSAVASAISTAYVHMLARGSLTGRRVWLKADRLVRFAELVVRPVLGAQLVEYAICVGHPRFLGRVPEFIDAVRRSLNSRGLHVDAKLLAAHGSHILASSYDRILDTFEAAVDMYRRAPDEVIPTVSVSVLKALRDAVYNAEGSDDGQRHAPGATRRVAQILDWFKPVALAADVSPLDRAGLVCTNRALLTRRAIDKARRHVSTPHQIQMIRARILEGKPFEEIAKGNQLLSANPRTATDNARKEIAHALRQLEITLGDLVRLNPKVCLHVLRRDLLAAAMEPSVPT